MANNTNLKDRYNAALREYNCCKSLYGLYPNQYTKPLEKAKQELDKIKKEMQVAATANIIAAAVEKATEKQQKNSAEPVKIESKPAEKKQEKKEEKKVKSEEQQPKEEVKATKELTTDENIQEKNIKEKNKIEEDYLKKHSPKPWKQYKLFSDEQILSAVKESGIKSIVPLENYSRSQLDAIAWYISKYPSDEYRMIYIPRLTSKLEDVLKSSNYEFDDFDLVIKEPDQWVYLSSELNPDGKVIKLTVPAVAKKKVKIIPPEQEAQPEQTQPVQMQINPEDSINPFLALQNNPGRLIPGYSSR